MPRKEFIIDLRDAQSSRDLPQVVSNLVAGNEDGLIQFDVGGPDWSILLKVEAFISGTI